MTEQTTQQEQNENEKIKTLSYTLNVTLPENADEIILKITLDKNLKEILRQYAVLNDDVTEQEVLKYNRYLIKGFISRNLNHYSRLFFAKSLIDNGEGEFKFKDTGVLTNCLSHLKNDLSQILDIHFNIQGERTVKIEVMA